VPKHVGVKVNINKCIVLYTG